MSTQAIITFKGVNFLQDSDGYPSCVLEEQLLPTLKNFLETKMPLESSLKLDLYENFISGVDASNASYQYDVEIDGQNIKVKVASRGDYEDLIKEIEDKCPHWEIINRHPKPLIISPKLDGHYTFKIELAGYGKNADEAWRDACEGFCTEDGGPTPDEFEFEPEEETEKE